MRSHRVTIVCSVALALCYGAFVLWYGGSLRTAHGCRSAYLGILEGQLGNNAGLNAAALERIRSFAKGDDGKPFFMLNLIRLRQHPAMITGPEYARAEVHKWASVADTVVIGSAGALVPDPRALLFLAFAAVAAAVVAAERWWIGRRSSTRRSA